VSNAGGLGTLAGGYLSPEVLRAEIRRTRALTDKPFAVNLFVPTAVHDPNLSAALDALGPLRTELGLPPAPVITSWAEDFDAQLAVVEDEHVPIFSFTFGIPDAEALTRLHDAATITIGTATNVDEALALEDAGVDVVCAQGAEAGGHHGTWAGDPWRSLIGTVALVPMVCDAVHLPVIAAGGIMDGRGVAAALCLGAGAAQLGTAFMLTPEAGTAAPHRRAMRTARATDTALTSHVTGRLARGIHNRLMEELQHVEVPPYPVMNALTTDLRRTAAQRDDGELMSLWCGQGAPLARDGSAQEVVGALMANLVAVVQDLYASSADNEAGT